MASISSSSVSLVVIIIFAAVNTLAHAQPPIRITGLSVTGRLCCNGTSVNCPGLPLPGVNVTLNCTNALGTSVVVGQGTTNASGNFNITARLGNLPQLLPILPCNATVRLPINNTVCPALSAVNGTLVGIPRLLGTVGSLLNAIIERFILLSINS